MSSSIIQQKTFKFAIRIINLYKDIKEKQKEYTLSKQILKSGTSIGANVTEALHAQSTKDFISKMSIAQKEAYETLYWIQLLEATNYIEPPEAESLKNDNTEILKILASIILTSKQKLKTKN
jgi:four helix bundle protein